MAHEERSANPLEYPSLRSIVTLTAVDLDRFALALEHVSAHAFGRHHGLLPPEQRRDRLTLHKLINLLRQLQLAQDLSLYELGFRCPDQLRSYHDTMVRCLPKAKFNGLPDEQLAPAETAYGHLAQVHHVVTSLCSGLS